jgi:hypothetical protein
MIMNTECVFYGHFKRESSYITKGKANLANHGGHVTRVRLPAQCIECMFAQNFSKD